MEKSLAKRFVYYKDRGSSEEIYISNSLEPILEMTYGILIGVYAVVDGYEGGEKLVEMDYDYVGEPVIIWSRPYLHYQTFLDYHKNVEIKKL